MIVADFFSGSEDWQGQEEGSSCEQGQVHQQDVPQRRLCHHCSEEPEVSIRPVTLQLCPSSGFQESMSVLSSVA
jgi:hypothetical protein